MMNSMSWMGNCVGAAAPHSTDPDVLSRRAQRSSPSETRGRRTTETGRWSHPAERQQKSYDDRATVEVPPLYGAMFSPPLHRPPRRGHDYHDNPSHRKQGQSPRPSRAARVHARVPLPKYPAATKEGGTTIVEGPPFRSTLRLHRPEPRRFAISPNPAEH